MALMNGNEHVPTLACSRARQIGIKRRSEELVLIYARCRSLAGTAPGRDTGIYINKGKEKKKKRSNLCAGPHPPDPGYEMRQQQNNKPTDLCSPLPLPLLQ